MTLKTYLTSKEVMLIINAALNLRDKLIILFLADCGCRVSELLAVKKSHIDFERKLVLIPHLKTGVRKKCPNCGALSGRRRNFCHNCGADISQIVPEGLEERKRLISLGEKTLELCRQYLEQRKNNNTEKLIPLTRQMVYKIIRDCAARAGLEGECILNPETGKLHFVHPHDLRASLATEWLTMDDSLESQKLLQEHMGHKRFETTIRYKRNIPSAVGETADKVRRQRFGD